MIRRGLSQTLKRLYDTKAWTDILNAPLSETDPDLYQIIEDEKVRQGTSIQLIPSENFTSKSVLDALGTVMQNKYSEGYPGARYYGGNEFIDQAEILCQKRALEAFDLDPEEWGVNVQPLSGSPCNFYVYSALLNPHERILALDLPHGGHLSHGYQIPGKKISKVSVFFETLPYRLNEETGIIDYEKMEELAHIFRPKIIIAGSSAYSRLIDYDYFRRVCDDVGAVLMSDMAHISGLVAAGVIPSPFDESDVVTTTTHKSLRGPRGAMIFYRRGTRMVKRGKEEVEEDYGYEEPINQAVFPGHQGGPHNEKICALATALEQCKSQEYFEYQDMVVRNCAAMCDQLQNYGHKVVSDGTDTHLILIDLKKEGLDGARVERVCELSNIAMNKNTVPGDKSALMPGGIRVGSPAMTSRGLVEEDFRKIGDFLHQAIEITKEIKQELIEKDTKLLKHFREYMNENPEGHGIGELKKEVIEFCNSFPNIGFEFPSNQLDKDLISILDRYEDVVALLIDSDKQKELMKEHTVTAVPLFHIYQNGKKVTNQGIVGADFEVLENRIDQIQEETALQASMLMGEVEEKKEEMVDEDEGLYDDDSSPPTSSSTVKQPPPPEETKEEEKKDDEASPPIDDLPKGGQVIRGEEALKLIERAFPSGRVEQLTEMGYTRLYAVKALYNTPGQVVERALEWLIDHGADPKMDEELEVRMESEEERKTRVVEKKEKMKEEMKKRRVERQKKELKKDAKSEHERRVFERQLRETREKYEREQRLREIDEARREKREKKREMKRMRRLIKIDKIKRRIKQLKEKGKHEEARKWEIKIGVVKPSQKELDAKKKEEEVKSTETSGSNIERVEKSDKVEIRIRLFSGKVVSESFEPRSLFRQVQQWASTQTEKFDFCLMTTYPRKTFQESDYSKSLQELGLGRGGVLTMTTRR